MSACNTSSTPRRTYFQYSDAAGRWTELLVDQFRSAGITMTGGKADYTEFNSQWINRKLPEVSSYGWATQGFDADNWFYGQIHSASPGNRWNINDRKLDEQQVELNEEARREIWRKMWDHEMQLAYRSPMVAGVGFKVYQPWLRGVRWGGAAPADNSSYYSWGDQVQHGWLDK